MAAGLDVLRLRDFRLVFGSALVSLLGDGMVPVALSFAVLDLTGSATDLGVVLAARSVALVGSLLIGGVLADRASRRTVMIGADLVRLVAQGATGVLLVTGRASVAELVVSQVCLGAATGFFNPASSGLIPLVAGDLLQQCNSLRGMAMAAGNIAGPAIAGALVVATSPGVALLIDAGSFGASGLLLARVKPDVRGGSQTHRFIAELREGFAEFRARTSVWATIAAMSVINAVAVAFPGARSADRQAFWRRDRQCEALVHSISSVSSPTNLDFYDAELRAHHEHLRAAYRIKPGDEVLDVGCGTGLTTREAARAAAPGRVVGVDLSEPMLERARQVTVTERLDNVRYELGDAQVHRFDPAGFDVAISRFGTMFFSDPPAAFANVAAALRPEARLVLLVWQRHEHNEWARAIDAALGDTAQRPPPGADAFSLGDAEATAAMLEGAGFHDTRFQDVQEPVLYGHDLAAALAFVRGFRDTRAALAGMSDGEAARAVQRLRETLAAHYSDERGVVLDSRSWVITARRRR